MKADQDKKTAAQKPEMISIKQHALYPYMEKYGDGTMLSLNPYLFLEDSENRVDNLLDASFADVNLLRVDLCQSCNVKCIFCCSSPQGKAPASRLDDINFIEQVVRKVFEESSAECAIQLGCQYEITFHKHFQRLVSFISSLSLQHKKRRIDIVTNCQTLDRVDLTELYAIYKRQLNIFASVHEKDSSFYEKIVVGGSLEKVIDGLLSLRKKHQSINIQIGINIIQQNKMIAHDFTEWAFKILDADSVSFRRTQVEFLGPTLAASIEVHKDEYLDIYNGLLQSGKYKMTKVSNNSVLLVFFAFNPAKPLSVPKALLANPD